MEYEKLKTAAEAIAMPDEMKQRIVRACEMQISDSRKENVMKTKTNTIFFKKSVAIFAAVVICLVLSAGALAQSGALQGFFRDITDFQGAVVGTAYAQATDEIDVSVTVDGNALTVLAVFADPQAAPYSAAERLGIAAYRIVDVSGDTVKEGAAESGVVFDGQVAVIVPLDGVASGSYKLEITAFVSEKKADQPLNITGYWEADFTK